MRLVVFDVDGTLVDSQHHIHDAMSLAFRSVGLEPLPRAEVLAIVGLSLPVAVAQLVPAQTMSVQGQIVQGYKSAFMAGRLISPAPLYPGALACVDALMQHDDLLLAVATGKSRRGLDALLAEHDLQDRFVSLQTADGNPSKPDPAMLQAALTEAGVSAADAVMVGDTSFDMLMAVAAGTSAFGVAWGYHPAQDLRMAGAGLVAQDFDELTMRLLEWAA